MESMDIISDSSSDDAISPNGKSNDGGIFDGNGGLNCTGNVPFPLCLKRFETEKSDFLNEIFLDNSDNDLRG